MFRNLKQHRHWPGDNTLSLQAGGMSIQILPSLFINTESYVKKKH